jgi:hypothetical protein
VTGAGHGPACGPISATVLPEVWEDESVPAERRVFPSDHGAVLIDLVWE